jgi:predicted DNA-binding transcriptional regulator YafY
MDPLSRLFLPTSVRISGQTGRVSAGRLVELLLLLQTRGRLTAPELAVALEVSVRTVHRDVEELSAAGVPIYAERGRTGGYRLLDGYRTRLTGLTPTEARALLLAGAPERAAAGLGLGDVLAATQLKLLAALPEPLRAQAAQVRERFHLDPSGWEHRPPEPEFLPAVVSALWEQRRLRVTYRKWGPREVERVLEPLGVVLKVGNWYLVARAEDARAEDARAEDAADRGVGRSPDRDADAAVRTYNVGRMLAVRELDQRFERPLGFDLVAAWEAGQSGFAARVYRHWYDVRVSPRGLELLGLIGSYPADQARAAAGPPDADGWRTTRIPLETALHAEHWLLRLGPELEVLGPPELRARMEQLVAELAELYAVDRSSARVSYGRGDSES